MTVSFEGVRVGDRVRLTAKNGDLAEFTVLEADVDGEWLACKHHILFAKEWDTLEILPKPLPTAKGVYLDRDGCIWRIYRDGWPLRYVDCDRYERADFDAIEYAPFTRLIPETEVES